MIFRPGEKSWDRKLDKACAFYDSDDDDNALAAEEISDAVADGRRISQSHHEDFSIHELAEPLPKFGLPLAIQFLFRIQCKIRFRRWMFSSLL